MSRTNVAQGAIAQRALDVQLAAVNWGMTGKQVFASCLSEMWANNGDVLSKVYAGTGALRSEFTRTGKRTIGGLMDDVLKNVNRFVVNNFQDDAKQAIIEILLGRSAKDQDKDVLIQYPALQSIDYDVLQW